MSEGFDGLMIASLWLKVLCCWATWYALRERGGPYPVLALSLLSTHSRLLRMQQGQRKDERKPLSSTAKDVHRTDAVCD